MEEKDRYEVISPSLNGYAYIHDFKTDNVLNTYDSCDLLNQQDKENQQLKQQLHDLPKEIVEEIREDMSKRIMGKQIKWGDNTQIGFICNAINECLDTILGKFGAEDESNND